MMGCPMRETCKRYLYLTKVDPYRQSYVVEEDCIESNFEAYWEAYNV